MRVGAGLGVNAGTRLGAYEILAPIGAGGMGEVYRARDTRLHRDVALKILPEAFASDRERLARFEREAQLLASLNHPNIAIVHGFERDDGVHAIIMELVDGPTLADRIARGPLPLDEVLPIARQIVAALEAAHEQGIIHRDLKPANVKVRDDGTVKVLDFGLAKIPESTGAIRDATLSPTITSPALVTGVGTLLGTAAYMSPEQAKGRAADKRSDIWALGCVLYEMVTGRRAFDGEDVADTLAAVLRGSPDWSALPPHLPSKLRTALQRSLEKERRARIPDASVIRFLLESETPSAATPKSAVLPSWIALCATALIVGLAAAGITWVVMRPNPPAPMQPLHVALVPPSDQTFTLNGTDRVLAISSDGSRVAYAVGQGELKVRSADRLEAETLSGISGARSPFISPDGKWVGFFEGAEIKKVPMTGGPAISVTRHSGTPRGASWSDGGIIVFATNNPATGLLSVSAEGGEPVVLTRPDSARGELDHIAPSVLPGGRAVLFTALRAGSDMQVMALDLRTHEQKLLIRGASSAEYVQTGHLVYASGGRLHAVPFDPDRLELRGDSIPLSEPVTVLPNGIGEFSISRTGTLVYIPSRSFGAAVVNRTLTWVDRAGREDPLAAPPRAYSVPRLSPDDRQIAVLAGAPELDIWLWDIARGTLRRVTVDPSQDAMPVWTPDGQRIVFSSAQFGAQNIFWLRSDGAGQPERLTTSMNTQFPMTISPDGRVVVLLEQSPASGNDLMLLRLPDRSAGISTGKLPVEPLLATMFNETNASISPDGRFVAYQSNDGGQVQVYVRPFPNVNDGIWPVSTAGGHFATWARNGKELFYAEPDGSIMAVPVQTSPTFSAGNPTKLFRWSTLDLPSPARNYDVTRDGRKFLMLKEPESAGSDSVRASASSIVMVVNWAEALKAKQ